MCIKCFALIKCHVNSDLTIVVTCSKRRREGASEHVALCDFEEGNVTLRTRKMTHHARDVIFTIDPVRKEFLLLNLPEIHQS